MKEFIEEYGGVIAACILGLIVLVTMVDMLGTQGQLSRLFEAFLEGVGTVCR